MKPYFPRLQLVSTTAPTNVWGVKIDSFITSIGMAPMYKVLP